MLSDGDTNFIRWDRLRLNALNDVFYEHETLQIWYLPPWKKLSILWVVNNYPEINKQKICFPVKHSSKKKTLHNKSGYADVVKSLV